MNTLVSLIIPCYNQSKFLDECLQSVLDQTFQDWECIIVNDGSNDDTESISKKWVDKDERFLYIYQDNGGLSRARNKGISRAKGEFILPLDADDKIANRYVELAVAQFQSDTSLKVVYCKAEKFGSVTGIWNLPVFSLSNLSKDNMIFCSALFKKTDWAAVGGYDVNMIYGWEDWEFWIAILKNGGNVKQLDYIGFYYRVKDISMLRELDSQKREFLLQYMSLKHTQFYINQLGSFKKLDDQIIQTKEEFQKNSKSEKFVIDLFCKTFFGFSIFGLYKSKK